MRPSGSEYGGELYECVECGGRVEGAETRVCDACGSQLRNISNPRDL